MYIVYIYIKNNNTLLSLKVTLLYFAHSFGPFVYEIMRSLMGEKHSAFDVNVKYRKQQIVCCGWLDIQTHT